MSKRFEKIVSWAVIAAMTVQPTLLYAQDIQIIGADNGPRPHVDQSANGTTVINIGTPNDAGVSHDIYSQFAADDLILNNSATNVNTQMGGWIEGNANLAPGQAAELWIGEVVGGSQTQLNGILEVGGQTMDVVLANEFGITCNGCGFVNTGRTTLTTGLPQFSADGGLSGFDVTQGRVRIEGEGMNPESRVSLADISRVDVIARAAEIYGAMRAQNLNIVTGSNLVDYNWSYDPETSTISGVTEQAGNGSVPALAVDVAALGGMYANAIQMVATEDGVGVRLDGEMASATNIALSSDGHLTLGAPAGGHMPQIKAQDRVHLRSRGPMLLEGAITSEAGDLIDIRSSESSLTFTGQADGGAVTLEGAGLVNISAAVSASQALQITSQTGGVTLGETSELAANTLEVVAATDATLNGKASAEGALTVSAGAELRTGAHAAISGQSINLSGQGLALDGLLTATTDFDVAAGADGVLNNGSLSGRDVTLSSENSIGNTGIVSAGQSLTVEAATALTNAATLISGNDLAIYADQILNNGGVIWANDSITLAANAELDRASLVQNSNGRIEAFQGDLTVRADEVANLGTAPTIGASEIIRWLSEGNSEPFQVLDEIATLIDPAYLDASGNILPAYSAQYTALFADLVNGGAALSAAAQSILRDDVMSPSGTALKSELAGRWGALTAKANASGVTDPAADVASFVDPTIFAPNGSVLPQYAQAYADFWTLLAAGETEVPNSVKAILAPVALVVERTSTDPVTGEVTTQYSNQLVAAVTDLWQDMTIGSSAAYDIVNILYQDRFNDDGQLAEMVAGATLDIEANEVRNVFGNMSAGDDLFITANTVLNQALGASQVLLEVHKKPDCFTCHEGEVDFYDTFGGRIEALGTVSIAGNLTNVTLNSSDMSLQDVMDEMNAYIQAQREASDPLMAGVPDVSLKNFHLEEKRDDDFTAPVENLDDADRVVIPVDTGNQTDVEVALTITPDLAPTAPLDALLAAGLNTIAETDPEFTEYGNFITSNYMMDVDRLQYRDELINNTSETILAALNKADVAADVGDLGYLDQPVSVPARDGSGSITVYPSVAALELDGTGALISGTNVVVSGSEIDNSGAVHATENVSMTAGSITGNGGSITADAGEVALTALGSISFEDTTIDGAMIDIIAGQDFTGKGVAISSETDASIYAVAGVTLTALENEYELTRGSDRLSGFFGKKSGSKLTATEQVTSSLSVGGDLSIITSGDLVLAGLQGDIGGDASLSAEGDLLLTAVQSTAEFHSGGKKNGTDIQSVTSHVTALDIGGDLVATAGGQAVLVGTQIDAGGQVELAAAEDVVLAAAQDIYLYERRKSSSSMFGFKKKSSSKSITRVTNQGARIAAAGDVDVVAEAGDLTTAGAEFVSNSGDINLTAVEGDIYAGTYTDVFEQKTSKSSGMFWGLISSSSQSSSVDQINTGTDALASLDLSLVSGEDTTLVGALLSAGQTLNIETGGDFSVQAAIDSQRSEFFSQNAGLVTMTTIQESSYVETAVLTQLLAAQALNLGIGGQAELTLYDQAGVDAPAPEDLYPDELLALAGLELLTQDLANEYFYDKQTSLSPAFKALVSVALSLYAPTLGAGLLNNMGIATTTAAGSVTALGTGANAFASTFILESLDGIVSGDFDLGQILEGAVFSGVSAGLSAGISNELFGGMQQLGPDGNLLLDANGNPILTEGYLSDFISSLPDEALLGFGQGELTFAKIMQGALDGAISSGVNSAIYGTDFMDGLSASVLQTVVNLTLADVQFEIGELFKKGANGGEGSLGHALLHGLAGCAAAEAQGADCAAGAAGAVAQSVYSGTLQGTALTLEQQQNRAEIMGAVAGYIFSGGEPNNIGIAGAIARSGMRNNRQLHTSEIEALKEYAQSLDGETLGEEGEKTAEEWLQILTLQAMRSVDSLAASYIPDNPAAQEKLDILIAEQGPNFENGLGGMMGFLKETNESLFKNSLANIEHVIANREFYDGALSDWAPPRFEGIQDYASATDLILLNSVYFYPHTTIENIMPAELNDLPEQTRRAAAMLEVLDVLAELRDAQQRLSQTVQVLVEEGNVEAAAVAQAASNSAVNQLRNGSLLIADVMRAGMIRGVTDEVLNGFGSVLTLVADQASVAIGTGDLTGATDRNVERVQAIIDLLENFDELPATIQAGLASRVLALDEAMAEGRLEDAGEILGEFNAYAASAAVGTVGLTAGTADLLKRIGGLRATKGAGSLCFVAGTPVLTEDGYKAIEDIKAGDMVISRDEATGETVSKPVVQLFRNHDKQILDVVLDSGHSTEVIGATPEHPFFVDGRGWVEAGDLQPGDQIVSHASGEGQGGALLVKAVNARAEREDTYNFEVADTHTYFVGKLQAWVHNTCSATDLIGNGGKQLDSNTIVGAYGNKYVKQADGSYTNVGSASQAEISRAGVTVRPDPSVATNRTFTELPDGSTQVRKATAGDTRRLIGT